MEQNESTKQMLDGFTIPTPLWMLDSNTERIMGRIGLTCALYFRGGHLPSVQANICKCAQEYIDIVGDDAKTCDFSGSFVVGGKNKIPSLTEKMIRVQQEKGKQALGYFVSSHSTKKTFGRLPDESALRIMLKLNCLPNLPYTLENQLSLIFANFLPSLFLLRTPPVTFRQLVLNWCQALQPVHGTAGWGITTPMDWALDAPFRPALATYLLQYPGLDMPNMYMYPFFLTENIGNINWLTIINDEFTARIGGPDTLATLGEDCPVIPYTGGSIIQAGPMPEIGDASTGDIPVYYKKVHDLLLPLYPPMEKMWHITNYMYPTGAGLDYLPSKWISEEEQNVNRINFYEHWMRRFG